MGGSITGQFEVEPPVQLKPFLNYLALREVSEPRWSNVWSCQGAEPCGAGLCVRRAAAVAYRDYVLGTKLAVVGRAGTSLLSGEDTEIAFLTCSIGLGMGVFPQLKVVHLVAKHRLSEDYMVRIMQGLETSSLILMFKWGGLHPWSPWSPRMLLRLIKAICLRRGFDRRQALGSWRAHAAARRMIRESEATNGAVANDPSRLQFSPRSSLRQCHPEEG